MAPRRALALAVLVAAGCGGKEASLMRERGNICNTLVQQPELTLNDAETRLELVPQAVDCPQTQPAPLAHDVCPANTPVCHIYFVFIPNDPGLCGTGVGQGCAYVCITSALQSDVQAHPNDNLIPLCGSQWVTKTIICIPGYACFG